MTQPMNAILAVALLLAMGAPATQAAYVNHPCVYELEKRIDTAIEAVKQGVKARVEDESECRLEPCPPGTVGVPISDKSCRTNPCEDTDRQCTCELDECLDRLRPLCDGQLCNLECVPTLDGAVASTATSCIPSTCKAEFCSEDCVPTETTPGDVCNLAAPAGPSCSKGEDDKGVGGTHVSCIYSCPQYAELTVAVTAADRDAATYGSTECGGTAASCGMQAPTCAGVSPQLTSNRENNVKCRGHSDEFWDSPVVVACSAIGADFCLIDDRLCEASRLSAVACVESLEATRSSMAPILAGVLLQGKQATSLVAFAFTAAGGEAFRFEPANGTCMLERFVF